MNKLFFTLLISTITIHTHAQIGLEFTSDCHDTILYLSPATCSINDFSIAATAETNCNDNNINFNFEIDLENDGIIDSTGSSPSVITDLPVGIHNITFIAFDFCSQVDSCEMLVEVRDTTPPDLDIIFGIASIFISSPNQVISITDFVLSSTSDNCTAFEDIIFSFSSNPEDTTLIICGSFIPTDGLLPLTIYATDLSGNISTQSTFILIQTSGLLDCPMSPPLVTKNSYGDYVENVNYIINTNDGSTIQITNPYFPNYLFSFGDTIIPSKNQNPRNGVTTYDLVLIAKHILGVELLDAPHKILAADANQSGTITALDIVKIRSLILHITVELPNGKSWIFDPPMLIVENSFNIPEFLGIKLGDVNDTSDPELIQNGHIETRTPDGILNFYSKNKNLKKGETYTIPIFSSNFENILGGQFTLEFDQEALEFQNIQPNSLANLELKNFGFSNIEEGSILCSWSNGIEQNIPSDEVFYNITFTANKNGQLKNFLSLNSSKIQAEAYAERNNTIEYLDLQLNFENEDLLNGISVFPNPFSTQTNFTIDLKETGNVIIEIFDASGKRAFIQTQTFPKGQNKIMIQQSDLSISGLYFYKIQTDIEVFSGKIILK